MEDRPIDMDNLPARAMLSRMNPRKKSEGFPGQRIAVLPRAVLAQGGTDGILVDVHDRQRLDAFFRLAARAQRRVQ